MPAAGFVVPSRAPLVPTVALGAAAASAASDGRPVFFTLDGGTVAFPWILRGTLPAPGLGLCRNFGAARGFFGDGTLIIAATFGGLVVHGHCATTCPQISR